MKKIIVLGGIALIAGALVAAIMLFMRQSSSPPAANNVTTQQAPSEEKRWQITQQPEIVSTKDLLPETNQTEPVQEPPAPQEDPYITLPFVDSLVQFALDRYHPGHSLTNPHARGRLDLSVKLLNMHYGISLDGLQYEENNVPATRKALLSYALTPHMLDLLFGLYGDQCLRKATEKAAATVKLFPTHAAKPESRLLTLHEQKEFFALCAGKLEDLGKLFTAISTLEDFSSRVENYLHMRNELNNAYYTFWSLNDNKADQTEIDRAANAIKQTVLTFEQSKRALVTSIVNRAHPQATDEGEVLYLAKWIFRRTTEQTISQKTLDSLGKHLTALGREFSRQKEALH
ncbi:MAG: hypothetical protein CSA21_05040 [Deltaproteobacteria bacterium]|nr:MAG: hypothetical protein CSA21_05040 [Deltaproteobacteria bacterium]